MNIFNFLGTLVGKRKQTILKKRWFDITNIHCLALQKILDFVGVTQLCQAVFKRTKIKQYYRVIIYQNHQKFIHEQIQTVQNAKFTLFLIFLRQFFTLTLDVSHIFGDA
jgi:hypothetical protein